MSHTSRGAFTALHQDAESGWEGSGLTHGCAICHQPIFPSSGLGFP